MRISWPIPAQVGQAPVGELKEKRRGSISGMVKPETGQANFWLKVMRGGDVSSPLLACGERSSRSSERPGEGLGDSASPGVSCFLCASPVPRDRGLDLSPLPRGEVGGASANSMTAMPSAISSAVSSESARRAAMSGRTTRRSMTTSMSCLNFLSSAGASSIG